MSSNGETESHFEVHLSGLSVGQHEQHVVTTKLAIISSAQNRYHTLASQSHQHCHSLLSVSSIHTERGFPICDISYTNIGDRSALFSNPFVTASQTGYDIEAIQLHYFPHEKKFIRMLRTTLSSIGFEHPVMPTS
jgi:hypothetical protein